MGVIWVELVHSNNKVHRWKSAGEENTDNRTGLRHVRKDQTSIQRTTVIYGFAIILLEPLHYSPPSLSLLIRLNSHVRLLSAIPFSLFLPLAIRLPPSAAVYCWAVYYGDHYLCYSNCSSADNSNQLHLCSSTESGITLYDILSWSLHPFFFPFWSAVQISLRPYSLWISFLCFFHPSRVWRLHLFLGLSPRSLW